MIDWTLVCSASIRGRRTSARAAARHTLVNPGVSGDLRGRVAGLGEAGVVTVVGAIRRLQVEPGACVLIGDSITDITAARAAGTAVVGYANKPDKHHSFATHQPDAIISSMDEIAQAIDPASTTSTSIPQPG